ncbi:putative F420-0 ABC transporter substrate-binding protein [Salinibacterium sp. NK8237]|uniref:putative F420-0 ABC transporter substrate-binding protein n=1 Tax=Salinibacterium sp. NK8237 TaxID=2792038 RepID=UPI0018CFA9B0|nr:putative F420-0 ABC transporter substrate-binding protein [Salinibacterium sp. NK8237]MBH0129476.1 putative F420-0 ABC transporter substrate-binding protein [Salinibacterium sp. NK8237]
MSALSRSALSRSALSRSAFSRTVLLAGVSVLALSGCTAAAEETETASPDAAAQSVELSNCGFDVTFDSAPERVITIKSSTTEMLLALGLGDRIIGTAFQDGPVPDQWASDAAGLTSIADRVPSEEAVLDLEPDLVFAGWESTFSADAAGERADLTSLGINTFVAPSACQSAEQPAQLSFENVFSDIETVASIFRVDATEIVDEQRAQLAAIDANGDSRTALWFSSGSDTPYVGAGIGAPQLLLDTVGLTNIAGDIDSTWAPFNWEAVVDADPDFIVLVDAAWNTADSKIDVLEANPATANLSAVKAGRYLVVPFAASEAGVRSVEAAESLSAQIAELDG